MLRLAGMGFVVSVDDHRLVETVRCYADDGDAMCRALLAFSAEGELVGGRLLDAIRELGWRMYEHTTARGYAAREWRCPRHGPPDGAPAARGQQSAPAAAAADGGAGPVEGQGVA